MSLMRWEPFEEIERTMNRMLGGGAWRMPRAAESGGESAWQPSADIVENEKEYLVRAELPGVRKEDVKVSLDNGMLTVSGERRFEKKSQGERVHRLESFHGSFVRRFTLPADVEEQKISAESRDGVLTIRLPKTAAPPAATPKQIEVT